MEKTYISDLDGTLLRNNAALSDHSRSQLIRLIESGVHMTVASARSIFSMRHILAGVPFKLPVVEFNGAFISDIHTGAHTIINDIGPDIKPEIYDLIRTHNCIRCISSFNGRTDCLYYNHIDNPGMDWYLHDRLSVQDARLKKIDRLENSLNDQVVCFTVIHTEPVVTKLHRHLKKRFDSQIESYAFENAYSPGWYWLTVHDRRATKARAIRILMNDLGFPLKGLTVFGDNLNDIQMFDLAPRAIAVDNAVDALKARATQIIGTNEDDSVVDFIMQDR